MKELTKEDLVKSTPHHSEPKHCFDKHALTEFSASRTVSLMISSVVETDCEIDIGHDMVCFNKKTDDYTMSKTFSVKNSKGYIKDMFPGVFVMGSNYDGSIESAIIYPLNHFIKECSNLEFTDEVVSGLYVMTDDGVMRIIEIMSVNPKIIEYRIIGEVGTRLLLANEISETFKLTPYAEYVINEYLKGASAI